MSDETPPPSEDVSPLDDSGINNDHILDLLDYIVKTMHNRYINEPPAVPPTDAALKDMSHTLHTVWSLVQDIMDLDRRLRMTFELGGMDPDFFRKFDGMPPPDPFEDDGFDDEDEEDDDGDEAKQ